MSEFDDIQVPVMTITEGWTVDEIETEDDCDDAFAVLTALIVSIEARMDDLVIAGQEVSVDYKRAKAALRWKKAAMSVVNIRRGKINRAIKTALQQEQSQRVMAYFSAMHPDEFKAALKHVNAGTDAVVAARGGKA